MYNETSIQALIDRIGWYPAIAPSDIVLTEENEVSTSGRYFNGFNPLAIVENVKASITNKDADNDTLNEVLAELRKEGVMDVVQKVYNLNIRATAKVTNMVTSVNYATDYSDNIISYQASFDDAIGLSVVIKTLEMIRTTYRSNGRANDAKVNTNDIQEYFHGAFTPTGQVITKGLYAQYRESIGRLIDVLFPVIYPDGETTVNPDGSITVKVKRPTLKGVRPW